MRSRLVFLTLLLAMACGDDGPQSPVIPSFLGPPKSIQITGDFNFTQLQQTRQLAAMATFANGQVRNVSAEAEWTSSNPAVLTVSAGLVRVLAFGDAQITATFRGVSSGAVIASVRSTGAAALSSLRITGPSELAPQARGQFTATGTFADGSTRDLTSVASWSSFQTGVAVHVGGGQFEARSVGDVTVSANTMGRSATMPVIVVPQGTFKLSGTVRDASGLVENVLVEVISGTGAGSSARTADFIGRYALFGVAGPIQLRASADGYTTQEFSLTVASHQVHNFEVVTASTTIQIAGDWTLIVSTSSACSQTWPAQARRREVNATVRQQGTRLDVRFPSHVFSAVDNPGRMAGSSFSMSLYYDDYYLDYGLLERIGDREFAGVNGLFTGSGTDSLITGQFAGNLNYYQSATANFPSGLPATCPADPTFELRRR